MSLALIAGGPPSLLPVFNTVPIHYAADQQALATMLLSNRLLLQQPLSNQNLFDIPPSQLQQKPQLANQINAYKQGQHNIHEKPQPLEYYQDFYHTGSGPHVVYNAMMGIKNDHEIEAFKKSIYDIEEVKRENKKHFEEDLVLYYMLLLPFVFFDDLDNAKYFLKLKMLLLFLDKMGVSHEEGLLFILFVQCVDIKASLNGGFRFKKNYQTSWYTEIYDYMATEMKTGNVFRLGTQMLFPQVQPKAQ